MGTFSLASYTHREALRVGALTQSFSAAHNAHPQRVVLKQLLPAFATNAEVRDRWLTLAAANRSVPGANGVTVLDSGEADGSAYLVVEHVDGIGLDVLMRRQRNTPVEAGVAVRIATAILEHLAAANDHGLQYPHLDVAPHSVIVRDDGTVVLTEHGLWNALPAAEGARVRFDRGRVPYLSPELAKSLAGDTRSDVFSTGTVLFELLAGARPFAGNTQLVLALAIAEGKRKTLHEARPEVPEHVRHVVEAMLAHPPEERFQSARAALNALTSGYAAGPSSREELAAWVARARQDGHGQSNGKALNGAGESRGPSTQPHRMADSEPANPQRTRMFGAFPFAARGAPASASSSPRVHAPTLRTDTPSGGHRSTDVLDMVNLLGSTSRTADKPAQPLNAPPAASPPGVAEPAYGAQSSLAPPPMLSAPVSLGPSHSTNRPPEAFSEGMAPPPMMGAFAPAAFAPAALAPPMAGLGFQAPLDLGKPEATSSVASPELASRDGHTAYFKRGNAKHKQAVFVSTPLTPPAPTPPAVALTPKLSVPAPIAAPSVVATPALASPSVGFPAWQLAPAMGGAASFTPSSPEARPAFDVALAPLPRTDDMFRDPSGTLFQMKSYAKARTSGEKRKMPLGVAVTLATVFGFVVVTGGYLLFRLFS